MAQDDFALPPGPKKIGKAICKGNGSECKGVLKSGVTLHNRNSAALPTSSRTMPNVQIVIELGVLS